MRYLLQNELIGEMSYTAQVSFPPSSGGKWRESELRRVKPGLKLGRGSGRMSWIMRQREGSRTDREDPAPTKGEAGTNERSQRR